MQLTLYNKGDHISNSHLFERMTELQALILRCFGLPFTLRYEDIISFDHLPSDQEIENCIALLHKTATDYLLSEVKSEQQILREALALKKEPLKVLQELNIKTHTYTVFVYEYILLTHKASAKEVLNELKLVNHGERLSMLSRLALGLITPDHSAITTLKDNGVKYIDDFHLYMCK